MRLSICPWDLTGAACCRMLCPWSWRAKKQNRGILLFGWCWCLWHPLAMFQWCLQICCFENCRFISRMNIQNVRMSEACAEAVNLSRFGRWIVVSQCYPKSNWATVGYNFDWLFWVLWFWPEEVGIKHFWIFLVLNPSLFLILQPLWPLSCVKWACFHRWPTMPADWIVARTKKEGPATHLCGMICCIWFKRYVLVFAPQTIQYLNLHKCVLNFVSAGDGVFMFISYLEHVAVARSILPTHSLQ